MPTRQTNERNIPIVVTILAIVAVVLGGIWYVWYRPQPEIVPPREELTTEELKNKLTAPQNVSPEMIKEAIREMNTPSTNKP